MGTFHKLLKGLGSACALAGMAFVATAASANLVPQFTNTTGPVAGVTTFNYKITLDNQEDVHTGDYFEIFDFDSYVAGSAVAPANWSVAVVNLGPLGTTPVNADSPGIPNLVVTYNGAATIFGPTSGDPINLGVFSADTTAPLIKSGLYASVAHFQTNLGGLADENHGPATVPTSVTPEAGSLALLLPGLVPVGMAFRRRIKRA